MTHDQSAAIRSVAICGAGTMGTWIALEAAGAGFDVRLFDVEEKTLDRARAAHAAGGGGASQGRLTCASTLEPAVGDADLVIETIPEDPALKADLFARLGGLCRPDTILTSNSSTLVSGDFATQLANPERFAFLHFYVPHTAVEIMPTRHTDENTITALETFAVRLGEVPLRLNRESPGYVVGAMLGAAVDVALDLLARGIADVETIDRGFMLIIGTKVGPLGSLDIIGLDTSLRIRRERMKLAPDDGRLKAGIDLLAAKVARGELGVKSGRGFYSYPNPTYAAPGFLRALPADRTAGGDRVG